MAPGADDGSDAGSGAKGGHVAYGVDLLLEGDRRRDALRVLTAPSEPVARQAAEAIAAHMSWPFEDAIGDEIEVRAHDEIDQRPERKPEPDTAPPAGITRRDCNGSPGLALRGLLTEQVVVEQGILRRRLRLGPLPLPTREIDLRRVERIRVQTRVREVRGCVLVSNAETLRLGRGLEREALHWLRAWIQSRLP